MLIKVKPAVFAVLLLAATFLLGTEGKSSGADSAACSKSNMLPLHGSLPQTTISPYNIEIHTNYYTPGGSVAITLKGSQSFRGFLIMALPENDDTASPIGSFNPQSELVQDQCAGGVTHTSAFSSFQPAKDSIVLTWNVPTTLTGNIKFYGTFVHTASEYWVKQSSTRLQPAGSQFNSASQKFGILLFLKDMVDWVMYSIQN